MGNEKMLIREIEKNEVPQLEEFLFRAIFVPFGHEPISRDVINVPEVRVYIDDYGRPDDYCVVAVVDGKIVGAAWSRILAESNNKGYGNIDKHTPELAISVLPEFRNKGIGTDLLYALYDLLAERGYSKLSLSVQKENPAANLYRRTGFEVVDENTDDYIMVKRLSPFRS